MKRLWFLCAFWSFLVIIVLKERPLLNVVDSVRKYLNRYSFLKIFLKFRTTLTQIFDSLREMSNFGVREKGG